MANKKCILDVVSISGESVKKFEGERRYLSTGDLDFNKIVNLEAVTYDNKPSRANQNVNIGEVIFAKMKDTKKTLIIDKKNEDLIVSTGFYVLKPSKEIMPKYLYHYLNSEYFLNQKNRLSKGATQSALNNEGLSNIKINIYNLDMQKKIVAILDESETLIEKRKEQIELLDKLVKSRFIDMFGDPVTNNKGWDKKEFSKVCVNKDSYRVPLKQSDRDKREGDYPYYGATGIIDHIDDYIFEGIHLLIAEDGKNLETKNKDIAFLAEGKFWVNNHAHVVVETDESNLYYLKYVINNINLKPYITGIDQLKLNRSNLDKIVINVPPIELQNQFEDFVKQVDKLKFEMEKSLKALEDNFNSLMQRAFKRELFS